MTVYVCGYAYYSASRVFANEKDAIDWCYERGDDASYEAMEVE